MKNKRKIVVICGPTATGKTELGICLAKKFNGEIVSADSRQVYIGMDIGTGKDIPRNSKLLPIRQAGKTQNRKQITDNKNFQIGYHLVKKIPIWLLDIVLPDYQFNVGEYAGIAKKVINDIWQRNKLPIIVGGTGLYIKALLEHIPFINIKPDDKLREKLKNLRIEDLQQLLKKLQPERLTGMNNSDRNNPRRLIRAIEIAAYINKHKIFRSDTTRFQDGMSGVLIIGLTGDLKTLTTRIKERVEERVKEGIDREIEKLLKSGYSFNLPSMSGLGYKQFRDYFEGKCDKGQAISKWAKEELSYAKRQLTWFKKYFMEAKERGIRAHWFDINKSDSYTMIENLTCQYLKKP